MASTNAAESIGASTSGGKSQQQSSSAAGQSVNKRFVAARPRPPLLALHSGAVLPCRMRSPCGGGRALCPAGALRPGSDRTPRFLRAAGCSLSSWL